MWVVHNFVATMQKDRNSDSTVEHRVLETRTFDAIFEYSNFRVIDPSIRVFKYSLNLARIYYKIMKYRVGSHENIQLSYFN